MPPLHHRPNHTDKQHFRQDDEKWNKVNRMRAQPSHARRHFGMSLLYLSMRRNTLRY
jgi:hypothetical protein